MSYEKAHDETLLEIASREDLFRKYQMSMELYKFYFSLSLKLDLFYFCVTSAILAYYFSHRELEYIHYALLLPMVLAVAQAILYYIGLASIKHTQDELEEAAQLLDNAMFARIDALRSVWVGSVYLFIIVAIYLLVLMINH